MGREEMEQLLIGYLYGELNAGERARVEKRLDEGGEWAALLEELRGTVGLLRRWEMEEPSVRTVVAAAPAAAAAGRRSARGVRRSLRVLAPVAAGVAAALLVVLLNGRLDVKQGRLQLSLGRAAAPEENVAGGPAVPLTFGDRGGFLSEEEYLRGQAEMVRLVAAMMQESEERQDDRFVAAFAEYARDFQEQREGDLVLMDRRLGVVEKGARDLLRRVSDDNPRALPGRGDSR